MSRHAQENLASLLLLALFGGVIYLCQDFGPRARLIPQPLAVFGIILTVLQLAWHNLGRGNASPAELISVDPTAIPVSGDGQPRTEHTESQLGQWGEAGGYAVVAVLVMLVFMAGIFPAVFVFTAGYMALTRYCSVWRSLAYAAILTVSVYLLFAVALGMQPYHGLLSDWM